MSAPSKLDGVFRALLYIFLCCLGPLGWAVALVAFINDKHEDLK